MEPAVIICGPTSTGKTDLSLKLCELYPAEIVSADSRQVYIGLDIVSGKDIPNAYKPEVSNIIWRGKSLINFTNGSTRIWLTDVVLPHESFNVSYFHELAALVIKDIRHRHKIPIITGLTGLYIKSLIDNLSFIHIPPNPQIRQKLADKTASYLFDYLNNIDPIKSASLNCSDKRNPRRLVRAIEISLARSANRQTVFNPLLKNFFGICLHAPESFAFVRINKRVEQRLDAGAVDEVSRLVELGYGWDLPCMRVSGCRVWRSYFNGESKFRDAVLTWQACERREFKKQLVWYKKVSGFHRYDVSNTGWQDQVLSSCRKYFSSLSAII